MTLEDLLRDTFADLADEAPGPVPAAAGTAVTRLRRRRVTAAVTAAAAAAAVATGVVTGPAALRQDPRPAPTPAAGRPTPTPTPTRPAPPAERLPALPVATGLTLTDLARTGPHQLTAYWTSGGVAVRRPGAAGFRRLPWQQASVARDGRVAVLDTTDATPGRRLGIIEGDRVRWLPLGFPAVHPTWSPDGRTVLVTTISVDSTLGQRDGFALVDTSTWAVRRVTGLIGAGDFGLVGSALDWSPDGRAVVGPVDRWSYGDPEYGLRWFGLDGGTLRELPTAGVARSLGTQPTSPSGRRAAVLSRDRVAVVDTRTGRELFRTADPTLTVYGWRDEDHLVVDTGTGRLALLGLDGSSATYATVSGDFRGRADLTPVG
jgi:hypothetical protein